MPGACPTTGPNSFIFAYIFAEKCPRRMSTPPQQVHTRLQEILDPPLKGFELRVRPYFTEFQPGLENMRVFCSQ